MPELVKTLLLICPLIFLGGFVDSVAGGGGLITLPAYPTTGSATSISPWRARSLRWMAIRAPKLAPARRISQILYLCTSSRSPFRFHPHKMT